MALVWLALAVGVALTIASLIYLTLKAIETFRTFKQFARSTGPELQRIEAATSQIERHLALAAASGTRLEASLGRLQQSRAQLTVLTTALADTRAAVNRITGIVPHK
jgi:hypothetical protein